MAFAVCGFNPCRSLTLLCWEHSGGAADLSMNSGIRLFLPACRPPARVNASHRHFCQVLTFAVADVDDRSGDEWGYAA